MGELNLPSTTV